MTSAYNPLDKTNLARSIEVELMDRSPVDLADVDKIVGAGIYAIYYSGPFPPYGPIRSDPATGGFADPIYVGKAIPKGGRKGGLTKDSTGGRALSDRLRQHAASIDEAGNLRLDAFHVRHLVVDNIWIPLGENMLIETFRPVWNQAIDGFGNKDPGNRRATQYRSPWDVLHPGRRFAEKLADPPMTAEALEERVADYFARRPLARLPRALAKQAARQRAEDEEAADDV